MRCSTCGIDIDHSARAHACLPVSPALWTSVTRRLVSFTTFFAVAVVAAGFLADSLADLEMATGDADPAARAALGLGAIIIGLLAIGSMLGVFIAWLFWQGATQRLTAVHGRPPFGHAGYWGAAVLATMLIGSYVVPGTLDTDTSGRLFVQAMLRLAGAASLIGGVLHTREWFRRTAGLAPETYSVVSGGDPAQPLAAAPTPDDWDASSWDPAVQRDIDRRRRRA